MAKLISIGKLNKEKNDVTVILDKNYTKALTGLSASSHVHVVCISKEGDLGILILRISNINEKQGVISGISDDKGVFNEKEYPLEVIDIKPYFPCEDYAKGATEHGINRTLQVNKIDTEKHEISVLGEIRNVSGTKFLQLNTLPDHIGKYIKVLWWFHRFDDKRYRSVMMCDPPYKCERKIGVFASRSPVRPNPIAITVVKVMKVDRDNNRIYISDIESYDHTPLLGILDYDADTDRVDGVKVPEWAKDWPDCMDGQNSCDKDALEKEIKTLDEKNQKIINSFAKVVQQNILNDNSLQREKPTHIEVIGARENNLKGIHVTIPYGKITAVVGVSGSGKSSLVMDTIYAECKRRMDILNSDNAGIVRPEMDEMVGCIPTVKISQNEIRSNLNSTIGTFSGIYGHLRSIYASIGTRNYKNSNQVEFKMTPAMFSYMDQECRCARCNGTGVVSEVDVQKVITDENKSLLEGASPFLGKLKTFIQNPNANWMKGQVIAVADELNVSLETSWKDLPEHFKNIVLYGDETKKVSFTYNNKKNGRKGEINRIVEGIIPTINRLYMEDTLNQSIGRFMSVLECSECHGERLAYDGRMVSIENVRYPVCARMSFDELSAFADYLSSRLEYETYKTIEEHIQAIKNICKTACKLGISYLNINRRTDQISGGEAQRLKLLSAFQNDMTGILYIFDEPSKKLGVNEYPYIINLMKALILQGNTILMVEHNIDMIRAADYIIEIGPGAGDAGGYLTGEGTYEDIMNHGGTLFSKYYNDKTAICKMSSNSSEKEFVAVKNVTAHNLKNVSISFPKNALTCITGASGSGKSTLMNYGIIPQLGNSKEFEQTVLVESKITTGSSRSVIATYIGIMDEIRELYASTQDAVKRGFTIKDFSFNNGNGRCECCNGDGRIKIPYTEDAYRICPKCHGRRYKKEMEAVKYCGKGIADVLQMPVKDASIFFKKSDTDISKKCEMLQRVGLGYLSLGHATNMLSGGEAARMKIASCLMNANMKNSLVLLDEPTCGLHFSDIDNLLSILYELIDAGNTVVAIEHNKQFIASADYVIDIGMHE